ncbi:GntR family transcriptional regulator [Variovorax sp. CF313]|uniref:GntR family transcriptional regulator n=1 Tax=Variovorax sp. CF313 TaxID=1144315 RepID=UPI0012FC5840|nr:GntR family transcriptional regulator [Variovorax sp. CF313]
MASQIERVAAELRRRILKGELLAGQRVLEVEWAQELAVSRTPLRLALAELEKQGLVERLGSRGYHVRVITMDDVAEAIDLRGVLEGVAARLVAEGGPSNDDLETLSACVEEGRLLLEAADANDGVLDSAAWASMNARFHATLVGAANNKTLRSTLDHVNKSPLADAGALGIHGSQPVLELSYLKRAQSDHEDVLLAIREREGARAENLMREHARRSRDNKRRLTQSSDTLLVHEASVPLVFRKAAR